MAFTRFYPVSSHIYDPDLAPTKTIQNAQAKDYSHWPPQSKPRFDTTYRSEYVNRIRHPDQVTKPVRHNQSSFNTLSVLPPINPAPINKNNDVPKDNASTITSISDTQSSKQSLPSNESMPRDMPTLNMNNRPQNMFDQLPPPPPPPPAPIVSAPMPQQIITNNDGDNYLPKERVLLTDFEEQRLAEQIAYQLGYSSGVEKLKIFYQELTSYDPSLTHYVHYSNIQLLASQLGLGLQEDTLRFAMCKFVAPHQSRGFVNYEELTRYLGRCLTYTNPHQFNPLQSYHASAYHPPNFHGYRQYECRCRQSSFSNNPCPIHHYNRKIPRRSLSQRQESYNNVHDQLPNPQLSNPVRIRSSFSVLNDDNGRGFDPDERQIRTLLKQNLKNFDIYEAIDFDKLYREFQFTDRNRTGVLNRQQIEEVIYKVRIPLQRSLIFQILEKHCRAYLRLYKWETFFHYLKEQILDIEAGIDRSSPTVVHTAPTRSQWLDLLRREFRENDRLKVIEHLINSHEGPPLESHDPSAWFVRFLRLANAMYSHRASTNRDHEFILPREEARRLFRAYNQIYDLRIGGERLDYIIDACNRAGNTDIDNVLKLLAK